MAPPKRLTIGKVPAYVEQQHEMTVTRQTVYNWIKKGVRGVTLRTIRKGNRLYTTQGAVDEFINDIGQRP